MILAVLDTSVLVAAIGWRDASYRVMVAAARRQVRLVLTRGIAIPVAQLGPDFLLLDEANDLPPGEATLVLRVDQIERSWKVRLPEGMSSRSKRVAIAVAT